MRNFHNTLRANAYLASVLVGVSCSGGNGDDTASGEATWDDVRPIVEARCSRCHSADRLSTYRRLETHREVTALAATILAKIEIDPPRGQQMPLASNHVSADGCTPEHGQLNDKRLTEGEKSMLVEFLHRNDHLDYEDTYPPLSAPEVPSLADSVEYTSSQLDVLNDGFIDPPGGANQGYMEEYGYDERDFDQMEDDWFCVQFDPTRTEAAYVTGVQVETEIGQIYLNSQLVIDTTGASDTARAAATESGPDWYRCDGGLGFSDAIPLWRTVPGGGAIELPDDTGLRFEPGWRFVLRVDFHTHFDREEFERLDQNGVIDSDAGTMTWFDRASLRVRWADAQDITRELRWLTVGPRSAAERDAFEVVPGDSVLTYAASMPDDGEYALFSAEVSTGKNGHTVSLSELGTSTCVANNADFSPKWIEQAIYREDDAPHLDGDSVLDLSCMYRNEGEAPVVWGPESEATVWGRQERCSALVFYYERGP